jgi:TolB-like protein/Tfp pilus assembly protein PilF
MSAEIKKEIQLEIAHVLFIDIVGYSKLSINEQRAAVDELTQIVRATEQFQKADAAERLIKIATGDGIALVFYTSPEAPIRCAMELSRAVRDHPRLHIRAGIHSGPVSGIVDVTDRTNLAGAGLNIAQRVMDCGDAGHILLSKHVAEDLEEYDEWRPLLHDIGTCEVKHGVYIGIANLYDSEVGNQQLPQKLQTLRRHRTRIRWAGVAIALLMVVAMIAAFILFLRTPTRPALARGEKSIAVLPFENRSEEKANAFFADGVQDEILGNLAKIADLKVISRTSVMQYKSGIARSLREIGQQLGVAHVVEGSVQRAGNRVRVNAQLVDARTDAHLWAQTYDRDLADVFAIQSEIAKAIAEQLQAKLSPSEKIAIERAPTNDITAFDLYTHAKDLILTASWSSIGNANLLQAVELLNQAVARDPSFFQAYCSLAEAHDQLYQIGYDHTSARLALADAAIDAAARLRPNTGETHLARARNLYHGYLNYDGALGELELARQTLPNDSRVFELTGYIQRRQQGRYEEATRTLERAIELDPRNLQALQQIAAFNYRKLGRYADAKSAWDRLLAITPDDVTAKAERARVDFEWKGDTRPSHEVIESIRIKNPAEVHSIADTWVICALAERDARAAKDALIAAGKNPIALASDNVQFRRAFVEGVIARMTKDEAAARTAFTAARAEQEKIIQAQPNHGPALCVLGLIDAALGRKEEALREGRRAIELLPVERDAVVGLDMIKYFAVNAAWIGDKDLACEQLTMLIYENSGSKAIRHPSSVSYGELKLLPLWDPLRGDPRFEKIVASLAPKEK